VKSSSIRSLLFVLAAELFASFAVWHGTPTDWRGEPPSFWHFEILRLRYWCGFGLSSAGLWVIAWLGLRRLSHAALTPALLGALCALGTEVMTSIYFSKSLSSNQANYLGWASFQIYLCEHLVSWIAFLLVGFAIWHFWSRMHRARRATPTMQ
jgi:hypothetical protein